MPVRRGIAFAVSALMPLMTPAAMADAPRPVLQAQPLAEGMLEELRWKARPIVVLGEGAQTEAQLAVLQRETPALIERDVVLLTDGPGARDMRRRSGPGFAILLIGKDGGVKLMRDAPVEVAEITALIDSMPMRQREAAERGQ